MSELEIESSDDLKTEDVKQLPEHFPRLQSYIDLDDYEELKYPKLAFDFKIDNTSIDNISLDTFIAGVSFNLWEELESKFQDFEVPYRLKKELKEEKITPQVEMPEEEEIKQESPLHLYTIFDINNIKKKHQFKHLEKAQSIFAQKRHNFQAININPITKRKVDMYLKLRQKNFKINSLKHGTFTRPKWDDVEILTHDDHPEQIRVNVRSKKNSSNSEYFFADSEAKEIFIETVILFMEAYVGEIKQESKKNVTSKLSNTGFYVAPNKTMDPSTTKEIVDTFTAKKKVSFNVSIMMRQLVPDCTLKFSSKWIKIRIKKRGSTTFSYSDIELLESNAKKTLLLFKSNSGQMAVASQNENQKKLIVQTFLAFRGLWFKNDHTSKLQKLFTVKTNFEPEYESTLGDSLGEMGLDKNFDF
ncbi:hypothetical protein M0811_03469 [Anaeramoeba ignava]|uniref:Uncharacterized protein n=1 Tax=Anaeramoeba ignava TaxID=1746090 RepID=A0A9Q0L579_ANAIG|nr:hypothetical protein M0811_03469 [Anaeramoeba ignava]|eukprot:Anaeramoba_ignava/a90627_140.p1 GENE.a90627_140~~a90627_140.p1  ORF type:complete len:416 (-),score=112.37 a90627_140:465-1712(-)